jgi:hypothetical protein
MTKQEKLDLQWKVRYMVANGATTKKIVDDLYKLGFEKPTIRNYIKAFRD